ncbi:hypothetical protein MNBD_PLANCTO02-308, partial [hydrothermal vent metagenome]
MDPINAMQEYEQAALNAIQEADSSETLEAVRIEYLGKKKGQLKELQSLLGKVEKEQKPIVGKQFNEVKTRVSLALEERKVLLDKPRAALDQLD